MAPGMKAGAIPTERERCPVDKDNFGQAHSTFQSTKMCIYHRDNTTGSKSGQYRIYFLLLDVNMEKKRIVYLSFIKMEFHSFIYLRDKYSLNIFYVASAE